MKSTVRVLFVRTLIAILGLGLNVCLSGCLLSPAEPEKDPYECQETFPPSSEGKESILLIGDSIATGYSEIIKKSLPQYEVLNVPCGAKYTRNGVNKIDSWLAARPKWKLITFNHGMWDLATVYGISVEEYKKNLTVIARKIKATGVPVLFFTTTYVPANVENRPIGSEIRYNEAALEVMKEVGIPVHDLNYDSKVIASLMVPNDIHFTSEGYTKLADYVLAAIQPMLTNSP